MGCVQSTECNWIESDQSSELVHTLVYHPFTNENFFVLRQSKQFIEVCDLSTNTFTRGRSVFRAKLTGMSTYEIVSCKCGTCAERSIRKNIILIPLNMDPTYVPRHKLIRHFDELVSTFAKNSSLQNAEEKFKRVCQNYMPEYLIQYMWPENTNVNL